MKFSVNHRIFGHIGNPHWYIWVRILAFSVLLLVALAGLAVTRMRDTQFLSVESGSMAPAIRKGDAVVVRPVDPMTLVAGEIVSYRSPANQAVIITHRILRVQPTWHLLVTKGDNVSRADTPVSMDNVIGKATTRIDHAGYILDFVRTPIGLTTVVYLPAALIVGSELIRLVRYYTRPTYRLRGYRHSH